MLNRAIGVLAFFSFIAGIFRFPEDYTDMGQWIWNLIDGDPVRLAFLIIGFVLLAIATRHKWLHLIGIETDAHLMKLIREALHEHHNYILKRTTPIPLGFEMVFSREETNVFGDPVLVGNITVRRLRKAGTVVIVSQLAASENEKDIIKTASEDRAKEFVHEVGLALSERRMQFGVDLKPETGELFIQVRESLKAVGLREAEFVHAATDVLLAVTHMRVLVMRWMRELKSSATAGN